MSPHHNLNEPGVGVFPRRPIPANFFPPQVRDALIAASQTPIPIADSPLRILAIDKAIARAKAQFPELFQKEY